MSPPRFALKYKVIVLAAAAVGTIVGVVQFVTMPRRADPEFTIPVCQVITQWPGTETERVEQLVTHPLEEEINTLGEVKRVWSTTRTGLSVIYVELEDWVPPNVIPQIWDRVRAKVDVVRPRLPTGIMDPVVNDDFGDTSVMLLAVYEKAAVQPTGLEPAVGREYRKQPYTGSYTPRQLEIIADRLKQRIALMPGVARAELHGVRQEAIYVETSRGNWANLDATTANLQLVLAARNISSSGGSIDTELSRFGVQPSGEFDAVAQIETLVVGRDDSGAPVYLKDLGIHVRRDYEDPPVTLTRYGNAEGTAPCVIVSFTMKDGVKVTDLGRDARNLIQRLQTQDKTIPPGVAVEVVFDESVFVGKKIAEFTRNMAQAVVIVVLVALLLSGFRSAVVMATAIPLIIVIAIGISASLGIALEQMSIASLIISLGMLVDNAVVVCDNVRRLQQEGYRRVESVVKGVQQIMFPILMGTLTTVFAFLPLAFCLTGAKQEYVFSLPVVVSITLLTSWVVALTVTPLMAYWIIRPRRDGQPHQAPAVWLAQRLVRRFRRGGPSKPRLTVAVGYERIIGFILKHKPAAIAVIVALLVGVIMLPVGTQFFPSDNREFFYVDLWLPEGSSLAATDSVTCQVEHLIRSLSQTEVDGTVRQRLARLYSSVGSSGPRFALGVDPHPPAANYAQIIVQTTDPSVTAQYVADIRAAAAREVAGARVIPRKLILGPPIVAPLAIRVYGTGFAKPGFADQAELRRQAQRIRAVFEGMDDVWDVHDVWGELGYQVDVNLVEEKAKLAGVTHATVARTMNAYFTGQYLTNFREGDHRVPIYFRLPPDERGQIHDPRSIFVEGAAGKVPLDAVAEVRLRRKTTRIERREMNRMIEVRARVESGVLANDKLAEAMPALRQVEATMPNGYSVEIGGEQEETDESAGEVSHAMMVGLMLIVLVLIVQYNSFVKPMVILMTVPMGALGAIFGLWLTGNALGFMPMLGLVSLAGIVVNSAILYLEFAEGLVRERLASGEGLAGPGEKSCNGLTREAFHQCLAEAGKIRLLPIFLTVSTTIGGLFPLALFGGPMWEGMAWLLIFGLAVATLLTLLVLPAIYAVFVEYFGLRLVKPG